MCTLLAISVGVVSRTFAIWSFTRKRLNSYGLSLSLVFHCVGKSIDNGEIDAAASLYCVFPLESSAICNKKAVLCTASFVISVHCFVQARQCTVTTKATHWVAFLLRIALVIPAVEVVWLVGLKHSKRCASCSICTHTALTDKYIDFLTRKVWGHNTLIYNNINMYVILFLYFLSCLSVLVRFATQRQ